MTLILVSGDGTELDAAHPQLFADDLAALRGDGVFETVLVRDGRALGVALHLARMVEGARILEMPEPEVSALSRAVGVAAKAWARERGGAEGVLRIVYSRGRESGGGPTSYVSVGPLAERVATARVDGVSAITLDSGYRRGTAATAPWRLAGAKALSYASNMAALRHAARRGADDAIFLADDGTVLEGPRSSVVVSVDGGLLTPPRDDGILPGTTQQALFEYAAGQGIAAAEALFTVDDLRAADGVWLVSSVTLAARVHTLNDDPLGADRGVDVLAMVERARSGLH